MPSPNREGLKVRTYHVLVEAISRGVEAGYRSAHKHTETPEPGLVMATIEQEVLNSFFDFFTLDDEYDKV